MNWLIWALLVTMMGVTMALIRIVRTIPKCKQGIHTFEPRYDLLLPSNITDDGISRVSNSCYSPLEKLFNKVYVYDICVYCGKTIRRKK